MAERGKRTVRDLRRGNRASLLRHLYFEGPLSRQELGRDTGLSAGSISNVVGELIADGMVEEAGAVESDGGRPRILLQVAPGYGYVVGVDVGETRVRVELFDLALTERAAADLPLSDSGHDVDHVVRLALEGIDVRGARGRHRRPRGARRRHRRARHRRAGRPGGSPPGEGDGVVVHGQTIGWDAVPLGRLLRAGTALPLHIDNGAKTLGQAEMWFGGGRGAGNVVIALIGSGVGACVVANGTPYHGASSSAGEWGHTTLRVGGRACRCGSRGCLEAYVGAEALLGRWARGAGGGQRGDRARRAAGRGRPRPGGRRAARRGRGVPRRGHRRPDQPLQPAADRDRRLGRAAARPAAAAHGPRGRRRVRAAPPRSRRPPSSWAGWAPTRSPSAPPPCRWPDSSTPAGSVRCGSRPRTPTAAACPTRCGTESPGRYVDRAVPVRHRSVGGRPWSLHGRPAGPYPYRRQYRTAEEPP